MSVAEFIDLVIRAVRMPVPLIPLHEQDNDVETRYRQKRNQLHDDITTMTHLQLVVYAEASLVLLEDRERLLAALPHCPVHGQGCVPHAIEWIEEAKKAQESIP